MEYGSKSGLLLILCFTFIFELWELQLKQSGSILLTYLVQCLLELLRTQRIYLFKILLDLRCECWFDLRGYLIGLRFLEDVFPGRIINPQLIVQLRHGFLEYFFPLSLGHFCYFEFPQSFPTLRLIDGAIVIDYFERVFLTFNHFLEFGKFFGLLHLVEFIN